MRRVIELIIFENNEDYLQEYIAVYVQPENLYFLSGIPVTFSEKDFEHIFSEPDKETGRRKFSKRRARKMHYIRGLLDEDFPKEILFEPETGNIAVFSIELDAVMYLRPVTRQGKLQVMTFFDFGKDHTKMYNKQRKKCIEISITEIKEKL